VTRSPRTTSAASQTDSELLTFLIADIRGYTAFTQRRGDEAAARLAATFAEIAREGVEARGGTVIELRGDEALAVFASARQALRAAVELQLTFVDETERHPDLPLTVGVGLDAGEAVPVEGGYRGGALNLAARLCSQARAAEILASQALGHLARAVEGIRLVEGPTLELKGLGAVVALHVMSEAEDSESLAARLEQAMRGGSGTASGQPVDLPAELDAIDPIVGRDRELRRARWAWRQARRGPGRVLAVIGSRGAGKTRLVSDLAYSAADDGALVAYANGSAPDAIAEAVGRVRDTDGLALLIIDDLDELSEADAQLQRIVASVKDRSVLALVTLRDEDAARLSSSLTRTVGDEGLIVLGPLETSAVRAIGALYLGDASESLPADSIRKSTGGAPAAIHLAVSEWAQAEATRMLGESAGRATANRRAAQRQTAELADNVISLQRVRDRMRRYGADEPADAAAEPHDSPYKGLATFQAADSRLFFGRERLVAELVARLAGASFLAVVGPSGSGKSSAVRAGLVPALASAMLPGSDVWIVAVMRPGEHPLRELDRVVWSALPEAVRDRIAGTDLPLRAARTALGEGQRLVLIVDQLEEVFTICTDAEERSAFVDALTEAANDERSAATVVATIRADFYGHAASYSDLAQLLAENHALVGPMTAEEYRRAIEEPAVTVGARIEPGLTDALIEEVLGEPGALPLLSTALLELWQHRDRRTIPLAAYRSTGGVRGAVARLAEQAYLGLSEQQQQVARSIMLRLAGPGEGDAVVRRRVPLAEFDAERSPDVKAVLRTLTDARLVTVSEGSAEVAHEALLREWPRVRAWLEEDRSGRRLHQHLIAAAQEWAAAGRDMGELYRGARLSSALDWTAAHNLELNELEREFLTRSRARTEQEVDRQRRTNRRLRLLLVGAGSSLVLAIGAGGIAFLQRNAAEVNAQAANQAATQATAQRLGAQALVEKDLDLSLLLARAGVALHDSPVTRGNLLSTLVRSPAAIAVKRPLSGRLLNIQANPVGKEVLVSNNAGQTAIFDPLSDAEPKVFQAGFGFFGGDGRAVLDKGQGSFDVLDLKTGEQKHLFTLPENTGGFFMTSDLTRLAVTTRDGSEVRIHRLPSMEVVRTLHPPSGSAFLDLTWFTDDQHLVTVDHIGPLPPPDEIGRAFEEPAYYSWWDAAGSAPLGRLREEKPFGVALAGDGHTVAVRRVDGSVSIHDFKTGKGHSLKGRHNGSVQGAGFSPDGQTLITTGDDRVGLVWDVASGELLDTLTGHNGRVFGPGFSPDGLTAYTVSLDGSLMAWDLGGARRLDHRFDLGPVAALESPSIPDLSADGRYLARPQAGGIVTIRDGGTLKEVTRIEAAPGGEVLEVAFSPDGSLLATGDAVGDVAIWTTDTWSQLASVAGPSTKEQVRTLEFSPDSSLLLGGTAVAALRIGDPPPAPDGFIYMWKVASREPLRPPLHVEAPVYDAVFSPDGSMFAAGIETEPARAKVWQTSNGKQAYQVQMSDFVARGLAFSPDGTLFLTGGGDGLVEFWDAATGAQRGRPIRASSGFTLSLDFDPSGQVLLTTGTDGTARLFDVRTRSQIGAPLPGIDNRWVFAEFAPDGKRVYGAYDEGSGYVWDVDPQHWSAHACAVAGRDLSEQEWERFLPDRPYQHVCAP
jgi:WD40 repeat protein/class 3 adenylate cyclase